ncbi:MAG: hypothetical protein WKF57_21910 [Nakamurella sp.]
MTNVRPSSSSIDVRRPWVGAADTVGTVDHTPVGAVVEGWTRLLVVMLCAGADTEVVERAEGSLDELPLTTGGLDAGGLDADGLDADGLDGDKLDADGLDADGPIAASAPEPVLRTAHPDRARAVATSTPTTRRLADATC